MNLTDRIKSFELLGARLRRYHENSSDPEILPLVVAAKSATVENQWFTPEFIRIAFNNLGIALQTENLYKWVSPYTEKIERIGTQKTVGVVMAGNIPAVGFHDFLCVLIAGHKLIGRLSSADLRLIPAMAAVLIDFLPEWQNYISFTSGRLSEFDAIIATGNDNTSRYFNFYFGKYPNIIRKNRNSIAILDGKENDETLLKLANDIMLFYGMGCRSISKIFVPEGYNFSMLTKALGEYHNFINHNKYCNNYDYSKSIFLVNQIPYLDAGCLLLKEDRALASRISVLHYEFYVSLDDVIDAVNANRELIQCVVSNLALSIRTVKAGESQNPALWDYADEVDTLDFLVS